MLAKPQPKLTCPSASNIATASSLTITSIAIDVQVAVETGNPDALIPYP